MILFFWLSWELVSIIFENDIFFKIKPALIEAILLAVIGFSLWGPKNIMMAMSERYIGEMQMNPVQEKSMRYNMLGIFWITVIHIILVLISAFYMSKEAWFFISGGLYYIFFGLFFAFILLEKQDVGRHIKNEEWFPIVDNEGRVTGKAPRSVCHDGKSMLLHPVIHLHIFNKAGKLYLQKRSMNKDIQPGKWDTSVGGHVSPGETIPQALIRETREEVGLEGFIPRFLGSYIWESSRERELVNSFSTVTEKSLEIDRNEIDEGRFWTLKEIRNNLGKEVFTPNFEHEFRTLISNLY